MSGLSRVKRAQLLLPITHLSWIQSGAFLKFISLEITAGGEIEETETTAQGWDGEERTVQKSSSPTLGAVSGVSQTRP